MRMAILEKFTVGTTCFDIRVGTVVSLHGLKGTLRIRPEFNNPSLILSAGNVLFAKDSAIFAQCQVEQMRFENGLFYLVLKNHPSRDHVEKYLGLDVFVAKAELVELSEDEWWVSDLIGAQVYTTKGELIGTVSDAVGEHCELLEITKCGAESDEPILVPFVKRLVPLVDLSLRRIEIDPIPGLLD
jgi:16S rRNA processing protein RimM